jgi:Tol biopolymer transport system component
VSLLVRVISWIKLLNPKERTTQVTKLENEFARSFSVSPDGKWIVFERAKTADKDQEADLWIVGVDGKNLHLLVKNGFEPSWR